MSRARHVEENIPGWIGTTARNVFNTTPNYIVSVVSVGIVRGRNEDSLTCFVVVLAAKALILLHTGVWILIYVQLVNNDQESFFLP